ncbi:hypothetical protein FS749_008243 [Ceratobasidium sp. UAMH 11750]|nr:hypothetical protein FS749_008243 [Ceratobasidium sp. UAMH 11750]
MDTAFNLWESAHRNLTDAINVYFDTCDALNSCCSRSRLSPFEDNTSLEAALLAVESELPSLETLTQVLENSIITLRKARNLSYTLVPVNILPRSLLLSLFCELVDSEQASRIHEPKQRIHTHSAFAISQVNTVWHDLTLRNPCLWTSIAFHHRYPTDWENRLSLIRARNAPLDVYISFREVLPPAQPNRLSFLRPKCDQIRSLDLVLSDTRILSDILAVVFQRSPASSLKRLFVHVERTCFRDFSPNKKVLRDDAHEGFLQNLTDISLSGGYFDWDCAAFRGLEHLQLLGKGGSLGPPRSSNNWRANPTLSQIMGMFSASPGLRTFHLSDVSIRPGDTIDHLPVRLEHLRKLSLTQLAERDLISLVPLIVPGSRSLTVHLDYKFSKGPATEVLVGLFQRSNIESIYFHSPIGRTILSRLFSSLPHVRLLHIYSHEHLASIFQALSAPQSNIEMPMADVPCPHLHTIHLIGWTNLPQRDQASKWVITNQPRIIIKYRPPVNLPLEQYILKNVSGLVVFGQFSTSDPASDLPLCQSLF